MYIVYYSSNVLCAFETWQSHSVSHAYSKLFSWILVNFIHFLEHATLLVSLLQDLQEKDQRSTMLQLVDKMKMMQKKLGTLFSNAFVRSPYLLGAALAAAGKVLYL